MIKKTGNSYLKHLINLFAVIFLSVSCTKGAEDVNTNDPNDDDVIETPIFDGYAKNLKSYPGHNRVKLIFEFSNDNIEYFEISWDNKGSESLTRIINKNEANSDIFQVIIDDLIEGIHSFDVLAYDKSKNPAKSTRSTRTQVYGANYISSLHNRVIKETIFLCDKDPVPDWLDARPEEIAVQVYYTNKAGSLDTVIISHTETIATLPRYLENTDIKYRSLYLPVNTSIDTFYTTTATLPPQTYYASVATKNIIEKSGLIKEVVSQSASDLYDGVEYSTLSFIDTSNRPQSTFILKTDLSNSNITISPLMPNNDTKFKLQTVKEMAEFRNQVDGKVLAAVNADFFHWSGTPLGPVVIDGNIIKDYADTGMNYTYFGIKKDGKPTIGFSSTLTESDYANMLSLVGGGGQKLITNGVKGSWSEPDLHPRTFIGYTLNDVVYIVVVDGRRSGYSGGLKLADLPKVLHSLGASEAINLDGGGSTTMVLKEEGGSSFKIVNRPSGASPRAVANGLAIIIK